VPALLAGLGVLTAALVYWVRRRLCADKSRLGWGRALAPSALASAVPLVAMVGAQATEGSVIARLKADTTFQVAIRKQFISGGSWW
jgi:energy-converting hydrogenase Eha subunit B